MQRTTFKDLYKDIIDYILLNLIFLATVLLTAMVTFGAALKALFYVSRRLSAHDLQVSVWRDFFKSFKEEFGLSTLIWFCT
ncbi:MAG: YesL family protein, partial [Candidatus Izemoplasmatales bacterium]|nr:YesL family protein [Candidatus Izemoplasmatales bacterium]